MQAWEIPSTFGFNPEIATGILEHSVNSSGKTFISPTHRAVTNRNTLIIGPLGGNKQVLTRGQSTGPGFRPGGKRNLPGEIQDETGRLISEKTRRIFKPLGLTLALLDYRKDMLIPAGREFASLDYNKLQFPLEIRRWMPGDSFHPFGMKGKKKVSDLLIDEKVALPDKENTYVLCSSGKIVWVIGKRIDQRFSITSKTVKILRLKLIS